MTDFVWYASYGSNISTERFLCYIKGGQAIGAETSEEGCKDSSLPIKYENITIRKKQYFAKSSKRWQEKSVAFIDSISSNDLTLGRKYLVTKEQFQDIVKQENKITVSFDLDCRLEEARTNGSAIVIKDSWYGRILFLGESDGYPIYTFTNIEDFDKEVTSMPSNQYLLMIASGLVENYKLELNELSEYLFEKNGVKENFSLNCLTDILSVLYKDV